MLGTEKICKGIQRKSERGDGRKSCWVQRKLARESDGSPSEGMEGSPLGYRGNSQGNPMEVPVREQKEPGFNL